MPKFPANLSMLYEELPFLDRLAAAATDGFTGDEDLGPYEHRARDIAGALPETGLTRVLFNLPSGDRAGRERGIDGLPGRETEFAAGAEVVILTVPDTPGMEAELCDEAVAEALTLSEARPTPRSCARPPRAVSPQITVVRIHGARMLAETFDAGFRIDLSRKDMSRALDPACALNLALPHTATVQQQITAAVGRGDADPDHSAMIRTFKGLSGR